MPLEDIDTLDSLHEYFDEILSAPAETCCSSPGTGKTILLVEDEAAILKIVKRMFVDFGVKIEPIL